MSNNNNVEEMPSNHLNEYGTPVFRSRMDSYFSDVRFSVGTFKERVFAHNI